jgi:hypothetical protein
MLRKLRAAVGDLGLAGTALYAANRAVSRLGGGASVFHYDFLIQPVRAAPLVPPGLGRSIEVRTIGRGDPALGAMPVPAAVLESRFAQSAECLGAVRDGELIGYLWLCCGPYEEDEVRCRFVPGPPGRAAWDFDVYIDPRHRLGPAFACLWDAAHALLRARGITHTFSRISRYNVASMRTHARLDARRVGTAVFVRIGAWQGMVSSVRPRVHVALARPARPVVRLEVPAAV